MHRELQQFLVAFGWKVGKRRSVLVPHGGSPVSVLRWFRSLHFAERRRRTARRHGDVSEQRYRQRRILMRTETPVRWCAVKRELFQDAFSRPPAALEVGPR